MGYPENYVSKVSPRWDCTKRRGDCCPLSLALAKPLQIYDIILELQKNIDLFWDEIKYRLIVKSNSGVGKIQVSDYC